MGLHPLAVNMKHSMLGCINVECTASVDEGTEAMSL